MKRPLLVALMLVLLVARSDAFWGQSEVTGTMDPAGNVVIRFHVSKASYWIFPSYVFVEARLSDYLIKDISFLMPSAGYFAMSTGNTALGMSMSSSSISADSLSISISTIINYKSPSMMVNPDGTINVRITGSKTPVRTYKAAGNLSPHVYLTIDASLFDYSLYPDASASTCSLVNYFYTITDSYGKFAGNVVLQYFDKTSLSWTDYTLVSFTPESSPFSGIPITNLNGGLSRLAFIEDQTDPLYTADRLKYSIPGVTVFYKYLPNKVGDCGIIAVGVPVVTGSSSLYSPGLKRYILNVTVDRPCIFSSRHSVDGGPFSQWTSNGLYSPDFGFSYISSDPNLSIAYEVVFTSTSDVTGAAPFTGVIVN